MSKRDEQRAEVLNQVLAGHLSTREAAPLLGTGERQARRLLAAYREEGVRGLVHGNRGKKPGHAVSAEMRAQVVDLATGRYAGVNHSHLVELLAEREGVTIPRSTLARILRQEGYRSPRPQQRRSQHRARRERLPQEGMLLQIDASHHDWLAGRGPKLTLLAAIDDATGKVVAACFHESEDARGYLLLLEEICREVGVPRALYSDRHAVFWPTNGETLKEQLEGRRSPTQFGRAMAELGIQLIPAYSPQAKGRIERLWGTFQDRLVQELSLEGASTIEEANAYLRGFLDRHNQRFAIAAASPERAYGLRLEVSVLAASFCFKHQRVVASDNTVKLGQTVIQILPGHHRLGYSKARVAIHESLAGGFSVHYKGERLRTQLVATTPPAPPAPAILLPAAEERESEAVGAGAVSSARRAPTRTPSPDHPWRNYAPRTKSLSN